VIPYGRHSIDEDDISAVVEVLRHGALTQGPKVGAFEQAIADRVGARYAVAVSSGTAALHLACLAAELGPGDRVVTSPNTFVASSNCALYVGAAPAFADIDPETLNISPPALETVLERTEGRVAIIPVHFGGLPCNMPVIAASAKRKGAMVIEDASHALGATYDDGSPVGNCRYSDMTIFSFHPVKLIAAGEGGMITTNDERLYRRLIRLRSHGIARADYEFVNQYQAYQGNEINPWYYEMQELGFNYRITDIQCALALSQLAKLDRFLERRREIAARYDAALAGLANVRLPQQRTRQRSANHLYVLRVDFHAIGKCRSAAMRALADLGVGSQVHYIPVHLQPLYQELGFSTSAYPEAEAYYQEALTIPLFFGMTENEVDQVILAVKSVLGAAGL
jgi:UDP-4-amino-4,6-dideoxy-N-acetyl-beta-L-altrosamine transaminase